MEGKSTSDTVTVTVGFLLLESEGRGWYLSGFHCVKMNNTIQASTQEVLVIWTNGHTGHWLQRTDKQTY